MAGERVVIASDGRVEWFQGAGVKKSAAVPPAFRNITSRVVGSVMCGLVEGDLVVLQQSTYYGPAGEFDGGSVFRLERGSAKKRWSTDIPGNAGDPLRVGPVLYVTGIGFVGKLDLGEGKFVWQRSGLARSLGAYVFFERPRIDDGRVFFPGRPQDPKKPRPEEKKVLVVDDRTGEIVSGSP